MTNENLIGIDRMSALKMMLGALVWMESKDDRIATSVVVTEIAGIILSDAAAGAHQQHCHYSASRIGTNLLLGCEPPEYVIEASMEEVDRLQPVDPEFQDYLNTLAEHGTRYVLGMETLLAIIENSGVPEAPRKFLYAVLAVLAEPGNVASVMNLGPDAIDILEKEGKEVAEEITRVTGTTKSVMELLSESQLDEMRAKLGNMVTLDDVTAYMEDLAASSMSGVTDLGDLGWA